MKTEISELDPEVNEGHMVNSIKRFVDLKMGN